VLVALLVGGVGTSGCRFGYEPGGNDFFDEGVGGLGGGGVGTGALGGATTDPTQASSTSGADADATVTGSGTTGSGGVGTGGDTSAASTAGGSGGSGGSGGGGGSGADAGSGGGGGSGGDVGSGGSGGAPTTAIVSDQNPSLSSSAGNETGGDPASDPCPQGEFLVGFSGFLALDGWHGQLRTHCAAFLISGDPPYAVTVASTSMGPLHGEQGNMSDPWSRVCADGEAVVGIEGNAGSFIDSITVQCAALEVSGTPGEFTLSVGSAAALPPVGSTGGTPFPAISCMDGQLGTGANLRSGFYIDLLQLMCETPMAGN